MEEWRENGGRMEGEWRESGGRCGKREGGKKGGREVGKWGKGGGGTYKGRIFSFKALGFPSSSGVPSITQ
jgi:hypothetical protein